MLRDGVVVTYGSCTEAVHMMRRSSFYEGTDVAGYCRWVAANAIRTEGIVLNIVGESDEEIAKSFISELVRVKWAVRR